MNVPVTDEIATATLTAGQRRTIERFRSRLVAELGDDLLAIWLYGSRARGDARPDSDVDLLVIADGARGRHRWAVGDIGEEAAIAEGESPFGLSVHVQELQWLEDRREIDSFFIHEVDRDKIVLAGSALE